jgi:hypothetical protein
MAQPHKATSMTLLGTNLIEHALHGIVSNVPGVVDWGVAQQELVGTRLGIVSMDFHVCPRQVRLQSLLAKNPCHTHTHIIVP